MRILVISSLLIAALTLVCPAVQAKTYGGFAPKTKFTFRVVNVVSSATKGAQVIKDAPIPAGVPNLKKGAKVTFTIGSKGELTGRGFDIKFTADGGTSNIYANVPKGQARPTTATVFKNSKGKATSVALSFFTFKISGGLPTVNSVYYTLR